MAGFYEVHGGFELRSQKAIRPRACNCFAQTVAYGTRNF
jgi:hypothetical protein